MRRKRHERGEGNFGCLVGLVVLLLAIFVAYKMIPIKVKNAEIREACADEAKSAGTHGDDTIRKNIIQRAKDNQLPITDENIKIDRSVNNTIKLDVEYEVPVDFPGFVYHWHFHHHMENPIF
ncbi:MAG: hypothetical protein ABI837_01650 [Acidobacteriota bacterium]